MRRSSRNDPWLARLPHGADVDALYDWLVHVGSLTARLRARAPDFRVQLQGQRLGRPNRDECAVLGLARRNTAWVREVVLHCAGKPVVFAHSVLPRAHIRGAWHLLAGLGARPLGAVLFSDPTIERRPFRYRRIDARHALYDRAAAAAGCRPKSFWARRSVFLRAGRAILVTEVFLPAILDLPE